MKPSRIALVGNPNCGKTSLFNRLTGSRQSVGNWPGVTVERKTGTVRVGTVGHLLDDLPGLYSLCEGGGEDEAVVRRYLRDTPPDLVLNLLDARQLERQLYLTLQLIELGLPLVVLLGMSDLAKDAGREISAAALSAALGVPVVEVVANREQGLEGVYELLARPWPASPVPQRYADPVETALSVLGSAGLGRFDALCALEGSLEAPATAIMQVAEQCRQLEAIYGDEADIAVADARYTRIAELCELAVLRCGDASVHQHWDRWALSRIWGLPIFLLVMYATFGWSVNVGGAFVEAFDGLAGALFVTGSRQLLEAVQAPAWAVVLLSNGLGEGIRTVASFIPTLGCLYLALGLLEDCGYLARAAFVVDRLMRSLGLPGRAFVPLMVGFGCNVPAILATRTLEGRTSRVLASMMIPFVSCGARLPVYVLFAAVFFPTQGGLVVLSLYLIGLAVAFATGLLLRHAWLRGDQSGELLELPSWHAPDLRNVTRHVLNRLAGFVFGAGKLIVPMVLVVNLLASIDTELQLRPEAPDDSLLAAAARSVTPALAPLGIRSDNWPATVGLLTGVLAKEAVAGTLLATYGRLGGGAEQAAGPETIGAQVSAALDTLPEKLGGLAASLTDPLGLDQLQAEAAQRPAADPANRELLARFGDAGTAFAYLLFVLLYTPCVAALSALKAEVGTRWMLFSAGWTLTLAYGVAWLYRVVAAGQVPILPAVVALLALSGVGLLLPSRRLVLLRG
ncbi:ferrous iron transport protein B [Chitinimonas lacunae]|uniref:Ferrous iron transport protein B n=1 Tax=Chitinimonas lacunae TaxID=1963018 RepID=A0ABV8MNZ3_9NEIS